VTSGRLRSRAGLVVVARAAAGGVALAVVAAWFFLLRDTAEPVSVDDVITTFREGEETAPAAASPVPEGVYVYATEGYEKTDALTGITHRYPRRSTITVTRDECGVRMRWDVLKGRSTTRAYCIATGGWAIASQDERHTFFGRTERTTYLCEDTRIRPAGDATGAPWEVSCAMEAAEETGTGTVVGRELLSVSGRRVATVHVRKTTSFTGEIRGTTTHDVWLARAFGVPVGIAMLSRTTNDSPVGDVHYEEDVALRLTSLTPRRCFGERLAALRLAPDGRPRPDAPFGRGRSPRASSAPHSGRQVRAGRGSPFRQPTGSRPREALSSGPSGRRSGGSSPRISATRSACLRRILR
jgi:hypothetical protein